MTSNLPKYTLDQIHVGMKIKEPEQLDNIYDTWIILYRKTKNEEYYKIGFIAKETTKESDEYLKKFKEYDTFMVYNSSVYSEDYMYYEE